MFDSDKFDQAIKEMVQRHVKSKFPGRRVQINWESPVVSPGEQRAFRLLELLAKKAGDTGSCFNAIELGSELGFTAPESERADVWLFQQDYIVSGYGSNMSITDAGRDRVETIQMERFKENARKLLDRIAQTRDDQLGYSDITAISANMGWVKKEVDQLLEYLREEGLIEIIDDGQSTARITSKGINVIGPASHHVRDSQTINAGVFIQGNMNGGAVAGRDVHQTNAFSQNNLQQLAGFITTLRTQLSEFNLPPEEATEISHDLSSLESQLKKKNPGPGIVAGIFAGVKDKLQKYAASSIALGIRMAAEEIWAWLGHHLQNHGDIGR